MVAGAREPFRGGAASEAAGCASDRREAYKCRAGSGPQAQADESESYTLNRLSCSHQGAQFADQLEAPTPRIPLRALREIGMPVNFKLNLKS